MRSIVLSVVFGIIHCVSFAQKDSITIECRDFENRLEKAFEYRGVEYNAFEQLVLQTLFEGKKPSVSIEELPNFLANAKSDTYLHELSALKKQSERLSGSYYRDEIGSLFELSEYQSEFGAAFWFWQLSWNYLEHHTIDIKTYSDLVKDITRFDTFDFTLSCNQKAFILMLGKILSDQSKSERRLQFYNNTKNLYSTFFSEGNVDQMAFENDFLTYLDEYGFGDSTVENQYFTYNFHISDLAYVPLPQSKSLRDKFRNYHQKLFTQDLFYIDPSKIVDMPASWDSLSLLKDIMRAYPDSMMFAPGKTPLEKRLEPIIDKSNADDEWFLAVYAGVLKYDLNDLGENLTRYSPVDFRSKTFRSWYALFILQEMFNPDRIKKGVHAQYNEYRVYPDYNEKTSHQLNMYFTKAGDIEANVTRPLNRGESFRNFNRSNYHLEIFNHELFADMNEGFRIQLKIDTGGYYIREASFVEPPMNAQQEKVIFDALSKYRFSQFIKSYPDTMGYGWMQIHCKQRTKEEQENDWFDLDGVDMVIEDMPAVENMEEDDIFSFPDQPATFIHGEDGLEKFIQNRMPTDLESTEKGTVYIRIIVNEDGNWEDPSVIRGVDREIDNAALDIIRSMPHWIPAENNGIQVKSYMTIPISFE